MKLIKGKNSRRDSLPGSISTISLPPTSTAVSPSINLTSASAIHVNDFTPPLVSPVKEINKDLSKGRRVSGRHPPPFNFQRAMSFSMRGRKGKEYRSAIDGSSPLDEQGVEDDYRFSASTPVLMPSLSSTPISPLPPLRDFSQPSSKVSSGKQRDMKDSNPHPADAPSDHATRDTYPLSHTDMRYCQPDLFESSQSSLSVESSYRPHMTPSYPSFTTPSPTKKLVKRRPVSIIHEGIELHSRSRRDLSAGVDRVTLDAYSQPEPYVPLTLEDQAGESSRPAPVVDTELTFFLPEGAQPADWSSGLERNGSSSTTASSMLGPSTGTEESALLETPRDLNEGFPKALDEEDYTPRVGLLMRNSTSSFHQGDDGTYFSLREALSIDRAPDPKQPQVSDLFTAEYASTAQPPSPTGSGTNSSLTIDTISSSSTARVIGSKRSSLKRPTQISIAAQNRDARSVAFGPVSIDETSTLRSRPPLIRLRSASVGDGSTFTNSVYSIAEVEHATEGRISQGQLFDAASIPSLPSTPDKGSNRQEAGLDHTTTSDIIESFKNSSPAIQRAFEHEDIRSDRASLTLRRPPPPPPHLVISASSTDAAGGLSKGLSSHSKKGDRTIKADPPLKRPAAPSRSTSLGQLWRRISNGGMAKKEKSAGSCGTVPTPPKRSSSLFVIQPKATMPEMPSPVSPIDIKQLIRRASRGRLRMSKSHVNIDQENLPPMPLIPPSAAEAMFPSSETSGKKVPSGLPITKRRTSLVELPLAATPMVRSPRHDDLVTPTRDYFTSQEDPSARPSITFDSPEGDSRSVTTEQEIEAKEKRRRYRQTLVDIKDDVIFHRVLEDLARLQSSTTTPVEDGKKMEECGKDNVEIDMLEMKPTKRVTRTPSKLISERKAREESIRAWHVTREIVQGERRHGRLLARGVEIVQTAAKATEMDVSTSTNDRLPLHRRSKSSKGVRRRGISFDNKALIASPSRVDLSTSSSLVSPLETLLEHLPRLLAVSLTLSTRFNHDPSPIGVSQAFVAMERELFTEIGLWAGQVGNLVALGLGDLVDRKTPMNPRNHSLSESNPEEWDPDERLGFADIISMPITRALRYKLLFKELLAKMPNRSMAHIEIEKAVQAADRIALECDQRQLHDLESLRRGTSDSELGFTKGKKRRPRSMGPSASSGAISGKAW